MLTMANILIVSLCICVGCYSSSLIVVVNGSNETLLHSTFSPINENFSDPHHDISESAETVPNSFKGLEFFSNNTETFETERLDRVPSWKYQEKVKGYKIASDFLQFRTKILKSSKMVRVRVDSGHARTLERHTYRRYLELKVNTWDTVHRVRIKVPYGFMPQELRVVETPSHIDVYAPYEYIEFSQSQTHVG